jgi:hypothetical protein
MSTSNFREKHDSLDFILDHHKELHEKLEHEHMVIREAAAECLLGSVFAGAPVSSREAEILPMWKKSLHTASENPETIPHVALVSIYGPISDFDENHDVLTGKERVELIERRRESYQHEYRKLNVMRNDLLAEMSLTDDQTLVSSLLEDIGQIEKMQEMIEVRIAKLIAGVDNDPQKMARRKGSLYK